MRDLAASTPYRLQDDDEFEDDDPDEEDGLDEEDEEGEEEEEGWQVAGTLTASI